MTTIFKRLCRHNFSRVKSKGDFHCGTLSKGHQSLWHSFKVPIMKYYYESWKYYSDFIIVALNQWELRRQGCGWGGRRGGGGEVTLKDLDHRQNEG